MSESLQFTNDVLKLCQLKLNEKTLALLPLGDLQKVIDQLDAGYKMEQGSRLSADIIRLDQARDQYITGIRSTVDGLTYHPETNVSTSAQRILKSIDKYGSKIQRLNYQSETSTLKSICDDLQNDATLKSDLQILNINGWIDELRKVNDEFNNLYLNRVQEKSTQEPNTYTDVRNKMTTALRQLFQHIEAHAVLGSNPAVPSLITELNNLIDRYNQTINLRVANGKAKEGTEAKKA